MLFKHAEIRGTEVQSLDRAIFIIRVFQYEQFRIGELELFLK